MKINTFIIILTLLFPVLSLPQKAQAADGKKIVILPFKKLNKETNPDLEVLKDGFSESLMGSLSGIKNFIIIDSQRVRRYILKEMSLKQQLGADEDYTKKLREIADKKLSGDYIIYGSFQKVANRIRVSARLLNVGSGAIEKAASVHGIFPAQIFELQDQLAQKLVHTINGTVDDSQKKVLSSYNNSTQKFSAYQAYMKARQEHLKYSLENYPIAAKYYKEALDIDPNYALAYAGLAEVYATWAFQIRYTGKRLDHLAKEAISFGKKAVTLAPNIFQSHRALAIAYQNNRRFNQARQVIKKAVKLNPNDPESLYVYASLINYGRKPMVTPGTLCNNMIEKALRINPELIIALWSYAHSAYKMKKYDKALQLYKRIVKVNPRHHSALLSISMIYYKKKQCRQTIRYADQAAKYNNTTPQIYHTMGLGYYCLKDYDQAISAYNKAIEINPRFSSAYYSLANTYYMKKDYNHAIQYYDKVLSLKPNDRYALKWKNIAQRKLNGSSDYRQAPSMPDSGNDSWGKQRGVRSINSGTNSSNSWN